MTDTARVRWPRVLLIANSVFWVLFWAYFLWSSEAAPARLAAHLLSIYHTHPKYVSVFGRALPDGLPPTVGSVTGMIHLPSLYVAYWVGHFVPGDIVLAQTDHSGLKLLATTVLSYAQWYFVGWLLTLVRRMVRERAPQPGTGGQAGASPTASRTP